MIACSALPTRSHAANVCEAGKNNGAGKFALCAAKAERVLVSTSDFERRDLALERCKEKLVPNWAGLERSAEMSGLACRSVRDGEPAGELLDSCARRVGFVLSGSGGFEYTELDCIPDLEECNDEFLACNDALQVCQSVPDECTPELNACWSDYAACDGTPISTPPLQTHQTASFGSASDGAQQRGGRHSFTDNGDGTITDNATGLQWEKKDDAGGIHDLETYFNWCADGDSDFICDTPGSPMDGTIATVFLATLNAGSGFAGHTDWRIPNRFELETLVDLGTEEPTAYPEFNDCPTGCALPNCSCTRADSYVSSTSVIQPSIDYEVWLVEFHEGRALRSAKATPFFKARAVRGGL